MARTAKPVTKSKNSTRTSGKSTSASRVVSSTKVASPARAVRGSRLATVTPQALVAEAAGTFALALAVLGSPADQPLLVGVAYAVLLLGMSAVSGGHFNPAVTFGLWAINKLELVKVPFYWLAQFIGALGAFMVVGAYNGNGSNLDMSSFAQWDWRVFWVELIGGAVFLFAVVAALRNIVSVAGRAAAVGLAFTVGLLIAGGLLTANATREQTAVQGGKSQSVSQTFAAQSGSLNPAIALAQTERDVKSINNSISGKGEATDAQKTPSHFTLSVVVGALVGAALGSNLYLLLAGISWRARTL